MKKNNSRIAVGLGMLSVLVMLSLTYANAQDDTAEIPGASTERIPATVFQAAGPTVASIQSSVDQYRNALGLQNNGNNPGPIALGRREINWDGGSTTNLNTSPTGNPFSGFLITRGALFTTPDGTGFVQAPASADPILNPPGGLAGFFNNPTYSTTFTAFSASRLFSVVGGTVTNVDFFVPGGGNVPATVTGFGAVFTDVDQPDGSGPARKRGNRNASTLVEYYGVSGELLFSSFVPASPGDGGLSFFGIVLHDARIAHVRITSGNVVPGGNDSEKGDVVVMDDFIYGEPQPVQ